MKRPATILAVVLVLGCILAPAAGAGITTVWSRFLAVKSDRVLVTTDDTVGAPSSQTAGTVVIEAGGNTPALSISGYASQTEPMIYLEDSAGTEVFAIGPAGELTTTGALSLGDTTINGDAAITGTLDVDGVSTFNSDVTIYADTVITGGLDVQLPIFDSGGPLYIDDDLVLVSDTIYDSGGALTLDDDVSVTGALTVTGDTVLSSGITDTGIFTITADGLVIDAGGGMKLEFIPGSDPNFGVGTDNTFTGSAQGSSILGGRGSTTDSDYASIGGGITNTITSADYASITGGQQNAATGKWCFIGGGKSNTCSAQYGSAIGGLNHVASGQYSMAVGGNANTASGLYSIAAGGTASTASGSQSAVIAGNASLASGTGAIAIGSATNATGTNSFAGGTYCDATNTKAVCLGAGTVGAHVTASGANSLALASGTASGASSIAVHGQASGIYAAALGFGSVASGQSALAGPGAEASGESSFAVAGGQASGLYSVALGGYPAAGDYSVAGPGADTTGQYSFASGSGAHANFDGSFVWADSTGTGATSVITDSVTMLATNGYYLAGGGLHAYLGVTEVATDTLVTEDQRGTWLFNSGSYTVTLPSAAAGLSYCYYNVTGDDIYIDVQTGDQVHTLTNAAGDRVSNTTAGDSICLLAIDTQYWVATQRTGTWSDAD